jgi:hypothetical protein
MRSLIRVAEIFISVTLHRIPLLFREIAKEYDGMIPLSTRRRVFNEILRKNGELRRSANVYPGLEMIIR